jgi:hypothetical protein
MSGSSEEYSTGKGRERATFPDKFRATTSEISISSGVQWLPFFNHFPMNSRAFLAHISSKLAHISSKTQYKHSKIGTNLNRAYLFLMPVSEDVLGHTQFMPMLILRDICSPYKLGDTPNISQLIMRSRLLYSLMLQMSEVSERVHFVTCWPSTLPPSSHRLLSSCCL